MQTAEQSPFYLEALSWQYCEDWREWSSIDDNGDLFRAATISGVQESSEKTLFKRGID